MGRYLVAGGVAFGTHLLMLVALVEGLGMNATLASALGFAAAIAVNYPLQYHWTFRADGRHGVTFARYVAVTLAGLGLNVVLFHTMVTVLGVWYPLGQCVATVGVLVFNFAVNLLYTFAPREAREGS